MYGPGYAQKRAIFHKRVIITPKVYTVFHGTAFYTFLRLICKPLEAYRLTFGIRPFGRWNSTSRKSHMKKI